MIKIIEFKFTYADTDQIYWIGLNENGEFYLVSPRDEILLTFQNIEHISKYLNDTMKSQVTEYYTWRINLKQI